MSNPIPRPVQKLIEEFSKLPGIGPKTASRLTFYLLKSPKEEIEHFADVLKNMAESLVFCERCGNIAEKSPCAYCLDTEREPYLLAVVEEPLDILALEKARFRGKYHVLGGAISPVDGVSPEDLRINQLIPRIDQEEFKEIILSTNPTLEGEATAMYVSQVIESACSSGKIKTKPRLTRIARGLPMGGDLEYIDEITLEKALEGRKDF